MCGIVGLYKYNGQKISIQELEFFTNSLKHRGPDGQNVFLNEEKDLGLGHTRLAILDPSISGMQPMSYKNSKYYAVFNGEIYNYIELKAELKSHGYSFTTETDTEVVIAAYDFWGEGCQLKFNGMWALAIWNKEEDYIFLSRDRFGAKPLYYYLKNNSSFAFASELKSFFHLNPRLKPNLNKSLLSKITLNNYENHETMLQDVMMLPQGCNCRYEMKSKTLKIKKWWETNANLIEIPRNFNDQVSLFKEIFLDACKIRMRSDVPFGSALSGGLDSSSVCVAIDYFNKLNYYSNNEKHIKNYSTFSFDILNHSEYEKLSEYKYVKEIVKKKNIINHVVELDKIQNLDLNDLLYKSEDIGDSLIGPSMVYKKMSQMGYKVSLDGHGADELLAGYHHYVMSASKDIEFQLSNDSYKNIYHVIKHQNNEKKFSFKENVRFILGDKIYKYLKKIFYFLILKKKHKKKYYVKEYVQKYKNQKHNNLDIELYKDFHQGNLQNILHRFDKVSMSAGVESRSPFLDWRLVCLCFSLPSTTKIGNGYTKLILRECMKGLLPEKVRLRKDKFGFRMPKKFEKFYFQDYVLENLNSNIFKTNEYFDQKEIREAIVNINETKDYTKYKKAFRRVQLINILNIFSSIKYPYSY
jgi:asparagine synthase (glutamine-hydrolysing)